MAPWVQPVAYCEFDRHATAVLLSRMAGGDIPTAPIWDDVRSLKGDMFPCEIDIIYGGFPCQDVSSAGLRKGMEGERTILYLEAVRLVSECRPKFVLLENVAGIRKFVPSIRGELEALGYDCRDGFLSAAEVGAPHVRNRWWLLAYLNCGELRNESIRKPRRSGKAKSRNNGSKESLADDFSDRLERNGQSSHAPKANEESREPETRDYLWGRESDWWSTEPNVGRVVHGIQNRSHRIKGLGNAVVPLQAREAFKILMGIK